ncbi:protein jag [candidate division TA06 bacterium]|uniref:RNA-binding protein KhpB n=1 Tax=candidate division TA06 bacterium TaxID=2250710 RepID=A0A523UZB3_UNCT6|nr:MAG: protein jag [candidate division TA06 bacterium]
MKFVEEEGKTVEEAIEKAMEKLGIEPAQARIEIIDEGSTGGILGIGRKPARVRVSAMDKASPSEVRELVQKLLLLMAFDSKVAVNEKEGVFTADISIGELDGLLIGREGRTLEALQHITNRIAGRMYPGVRVNVDVGGYKARHNQLLRRKAKETAERVRRFGKEVTMDPLQSRERRIVHLALQNDPDVRTYTVGNGPARNVVVAPREKSKEDRPSEPA